jgi:propionate catabolism operon transcriptional regulator
MEVYREKFKIYKTIKFESAAIELLKNYKWRGNVRQLQNFIERIYVYDLSGNIGIQEVKELLREFDMFTHFENDDNIQNEMGVYDKRILHNVTFELIKEAIDMFGGNKTRAAKYLGVSRTYIWRKLKEAEN